MVTAPAALHGRLGLTHPPTRHRLGRLGQRSAWDTKTITTPASLRPVARRIHLLDREIADHTRASTLLVRA